MNNMVKVEPNALSDSAIDLIGKEWLLVSAGDKDNFNTMTASWGSLGFFFNMNVATIVIRPERYTFQFLESSSHFTLTILKSGYREAQTLLGKLSGRNSDKVAQSGLTPIFTEAGNPTFEQARIVLECRKIYGQDMSKDSFVDQSIYGKWYGEGHGNLHKIYMGEIVNCWIEE
ncbi:MAG: flavin reductase [Rikenellaceae bacterium]